MSIFFDFSSYHDKKIYSRFYKAIFIFKLDNKVLNKVFYGILNAIKVLSLIVNRLYHFIVNASYRKESFKDRKRILNFIKTRIFPF